MGRGYLPWEDGFIKYLSIILDVLTEGNLWI